MELPASEVEFWKSYYSIFPLPQERTDQWMAMALSTIYNTSGKTFKNIIKPDVFLPDYLGERIATDKSLEQQRTEFMEFKAKLNAYNSQI